jgi:hypothetical protein
LPSKSSFHPAAWSAGLRVLIPSSAPRQHRELIAKVNEISDVYFISACCAGGLAEARRKGVTYRGKAVQTQQLFGFRGLRAGMEFAVHVAQAVASDMGIDLGGADIGVPE